MKNSVCIAALTVLLCACGSVRKSTENISVRNDSTVLNTLQRSRDSVSYVKTLVLRDSVITIPARQVKDTLSVTALQPAYTKEAQAVTRAYTADAKGVHAFLNVLPGGQVEYGCNADSLTVVVHALIRENTELLGRYDSIRQVYNTTKNENSAVQRSSVTKTRSFLTEMWPWLLALIVIILAAYFVKRFMKWPL